MNRCIDGVATADEREQLARAMKADPMLRAEFEELQSVHASTESLFRQISLPQDFSARVMRRVQRSDVPGDANQESVRLPAQRPLGSRPRSSGTHRRRARVYAIVASFSAAAAMLLALGVLTGFFARAGIGTQGVAPAYQDLAEGRQGGPDVEGLNRTDPSSPPPSVTPKGNGQSDFTPTPEDPHEPDASPEHEDSTVPRTEPESAADEVVGSNENRGSEPADPIPVKEVESPPSPAPDAGTVVEEPAESEPEAPAPVEPHEPEGAIEQPDIPREDKTSAAPAERVQLGRMFVLNGRAEMVDSTGGTTALGEEHLLYVGDRIRTSVNGLILLRTESGDVTLYRGSELSLESEGLFALQSGTVALDRSDAQSGTDIAVRADDFTVYLNHGCATVERKRRGLVVQKAIGFASVSHDEFGTVLLDVQSGYDLELEFGKPAGEPKARPQRVSDWLAESRAKTVMLAVQPALAERGYASRELRFVEDRLPTRLEKVLRHPTGSEGVRDFLVDSLANESLDGASLILMVNELEIAYLEVSELSPEVITDHARRAVLAAEDFTQWKDYFYRLMRPPVEPKNPPQPVPAKGGSTECPNDDKLKRVDTPPKKKIVKVPQTPSDQPQQSEKQEDAQE